MAGGQLEITIGADVKAAVDGMNQVKFSLGEVESAMKELKAARLNIVDDAALKQSNVAISNLTSTLRNLKNVGVAGFDEMGRKIEATTSGPISGAYGALRKLANILPGIGIAGLVGGAVGILGELAASASNSADAMDKLNHVMAESGAKAQAEISDVKALSSILLDETNARDLRISAFKKLQAEYPNALSNLSLEKNSLGDIQTALNKVTDALLRQAQIKGLEGAIADLYKKQAELLTASSKEILSNASAWDKVKAAVLGVAGSGGGAGFAGLTSASLVGSHAEDIEDIKKQAAALNDQLKELLKTSLTLNDKKILSNKDKKTQDDTLRFLEETKKNLEALSKTDLRPVFQRFNDSAAGAFNQLNTDILQKKIEKALSDGAKGGVSKGNISAFVDSLKGLFDKTANANLLVPVTAKIDDSALPKMSGDLQKQLKKLDQNAYLHLKIAGFDQDEVKAGIDAGQVALAKINAALSHFKISGVENLAESIGAALGSGAKPIDAAKESILNSVGDLIERIGKALIEYGIVKTGLDTVLKAGVALPGVAALAIGAAAVAIGALVKNLGSVHAFADGGIVTGPTLGLVGEAGPEAIIPINKLQQFIKGNTQGGGQQVTVTGKLSGHDLILVHDRARKRQGMI